jgi:hypothetical protein
VAVTYHVGDEPEDVKEALWLMWHVKGIVERLRASGVPDGERKRLLGLVRAAQHALAGTDLDRLGHRLQVLVAGLERVTRDGAELTQCGRWALGAALGVELADVGGSGIARDVLTEAAEAWPKRGKAKWGPLHRLAVAVGAVGRGTDQASFEQSVSRLLGSRTES